MIQILRMFDRMKNGTKFSFHIWSTFSSHPFPFDGAAIENEQRMNRLILTVQFVGMR